MTPADLVARHPTLLHIADARNWTSIRTHGLLSTAAILDLFAVDGPARHAVESSHRPEAVAVTHADHGAAHVRDQHPLSPVALSKCVEGVTVEEWFRLLNGRVYFWPTRDRMERMLKFYLDTEQAVFEIDTAKLLERHGHRVELSHINSGFAVEFYKPPKRGRFTFVPLGDYVYSARNAVAELTVPYAVPDIFDCTTRVVGRLRGRDERVLWPA